jgi:hypothetical protein
MNYAIKGERRKEEGNLLSGTKNKQSATFFDNNL